MNYSRRKFGFFLPALLAVSATAAENERPLPSKTYPFDELPVNVNGLNRSHPVLDGKTHTSFPVELHITDLAPGQAPHPPHQHVHEEMVMIREGTLEVTIEQSTTHLGPGSVVYVASNQKHGWRNAGATRAQYFVIALGREPSSQS